jgi:hypothetical protein
MIISVYNTLDIMQILVNQLPLWTVPFSVLCMQLFTALEVNAPRGFLCIFHSDEMSTKGLSFQGVSLIVSFLSD